MKISKKQLQQLVESVVEEQIRLIPKDGSYPVAYEGALNALAILDDKMKALYKIAQPHEKKQLLQVHKLLREIEGIMGLVQ